MKYIITITLFIFCVFSVHAQFRQRFDGLDTLPINSLFPQIDTSAPNDWQIGAPQKNIFDAPMSSPNVIVTDTVNPYHNYNSIFKFKAPVNGFPFAIYSLRWTQKLDIDSNDLGYVDFSLDQGVTWHTPFDSVLTYHYYGFQNANIDTLISGEKGFSGLDSIWRDVWYCFKPYVLSGVDSVLFRFTLKSDTIPNVSHEGWMIDNFYWSLTVPHTVMQTLKKEKVAIFPTLVQHNQFTVAADNSIGSNKIDEILIIDFQGKVVQQVKNTALQHIISTNNLSNGEYVVKVILGDLVKNIRITILNE